ncbi:LamG-like jellyroll fold domain-containing protein [Nonlabens marinus]|uniref:LamG-like jellyroll fold domain-containing protein n=1 Tax=Nonlabens marinus TaxID=930802 RepID=UPI00130EF906|nr:LamG-like jellyroll fold domain-containing protein [Nonlabens marinus]
MSNTIIAQKSKEHNAGFTERTDSQKPILSLKDAPLFQVNATHQLEKVDISNIAPITETLITKTSSATYNLASAKVAHEPVGSTRENFYYHNMEMDFTGWTTSSTNGLEWAVGTTGEKGEGSYLVTTPYGSYPSNAQAYVTTATISTIGFTNIQLSLDFLTLLTDVEDGLRVEYSSNNGFSWTVLGNDGTGSGASNWYNNSTVSAFSSTASAWTGNNSSNDPNISRFEQATYPLPLTLSNNANVKFRFVFASNNNRSGIGVAVDNLILTGQRTIPATITTGPANVSSQLSLWLRSSDLALSNGDPMNIWEDKALNHDAVEYTAKAPSYTNNSVDNVNFNPSVTFDRSQGQHMRGIGGFNSQDYWVVVRSDLNTSKEISDETVLIGGKYSVENPSNDPSGLGWGPVSARFSSEVLAHCIDPISENDAASGSYGRAFTNSSRTFDDVRIINVKNNSTNNQSEIYINGRKVDNTTGQTTVSNAVLNFQQFTNIPYYLGVGRYTLTGLPFESHLNGQLTEVFSYRTRKSNTEQQRIYSYLSIKNGVSLQAPTTSLSVNDHQATWDYIDSNGDVIWDFASNSGFAYDVAAIGRDDLYQLNQKQSQSENSTSIVAIGLDEVKDIGTDNPNSFAANREFMIWGHNNGDLYKASAAITHTVGTTISVPTSMERMNRIWKIKERTTGDIGFLEFRVPTSAFAGLSPVTGEKERVLIIADDPNFTVNLRTVFFKTSGAYERVKVELDGTKYFSLGVADVVYSTQGLEFDGVDDFIEVLDGKNIESNFTISAWVYSTGSNNSNSNRTIISKRNGTDGFQFYIGNDNKVNVYWHNGTAQTLVTNTAINNNAWTHVAAIYDGTVVKLYIDGILDNSATRTPPVANSNIMAIGARKRSKTNIVNRFKGQLDEIRIWNTALTEDQLRYIMNQEVMDNSSLVAGEIMPLGVTKDAIKTVTWDKLQAYYDLNSYIGTALNDHSINKSHGQMAYEDQYTMKIQSAPLPYVTQSNGIWENQSNWENGSMLFTPGSTRVINGSSVKVDWNIVRSKDSIVINSTDVELLGLMVESDTLRVQNNHGLSVTHYLKLDGKIDLVGEAQLVQNDQSDLDPLSSGNLERDQQGTGDVYNYNYWASPVSFINNTTNNTGYSLASNLKDGTDEDNPRDLNFTTRSNPNGAIATTSTAATISSRWLYKYSNLTSGVYANWQAIENGDMLNPGEAFTMKGTGSSTDQNYTFVGKPNNGDMDLAITAGNDYLVGNPYPSAMDAQAFLTDNTDLDGTLYFWEHWGGGSHILAEYQGGYAMYNYSGGTPTATKGTSHPLVNADGTANKVPGRYVAVSQGFFVIGENTGTIKFRNTQRIFEKESSGNSVFVSAPGSSATNPALDYNPQPDNRTKIRLGFDSPNLIHRQLLLTIDPKATLAYDRGYDGLQFDDQMDDMAFLIGSDKYSIQGIGSIEEQVELPLFVKLKDNGTIKIGLDHIQNLDEKTPIYIKDEVTQTLHDLRESAFESPFLFKGQYKSRFSVVFKNQGTLGSDLITDQEAIIVFTPRNGSTIQIKTPTSIQLQTVSIINMLGQVIHTVDVRTASGEISIPRNNWATGSYIVKMTTDDQMYSRKVILD